ncbi:DNA-directed RNA polymerase subunit beta [Fictibacillus iocasae]|uniref:DNA-directed RNA polymerase subunit beta n=1 Tax=Fictibacillus iocasae TaxID=2715437 RepID=A0ABW2NQD2_9BACL
MAQEHEPAAKTQRYKEKEKTKEKSLRDEKKKSSGGYKRRAFPIWLRLIVILSLMVILFAAGTMVGYGVLGGKEANDVFKKETWTHIVDLVKKEK